MSWLSTIRRKASSMGAKSPEPVDSTFAIAATTPNLPRTKPGLDDLKAKLPDLRIAIIGAGIGGLAAAVALKKAGFKSVTLYEQSRTIEEVGAGIQVAPNESRLLRRWGCLDELSKSAVPLLGNSIRRYADDTEVGTSKFMPGVEESYGAPLWVVHRADLQRCLLNAAKRLGADIRTHARVVEVDVGTQDTDDVLRTDTVQVPRFKVHNKDEEEGAWIEADVIIAADGIRSKTRKAMMDRHGAVDEAVDTGDAAYRITIPRSKFEEKDPELMKVIDDARGLRWMGPGGHIMAYPIRAQQIYNIVLIHPSRSDVVESWTSTGPRKHMDDFYASWSPTVRRLLALVEEDEIPEWNLRIHKPLKTWVEGSVALMGDACHPTLPYVAQGAAQAVEDAGVLAVVLSMCAKKEHINPSLLAYMEVRKSRAEAVVASASKTRVVLHLPDGPEQVDRDDRIGRASVGESVNPDLWGDKYFQRWVWGTDIQQQALDRYNDLITEAMARKAIFSRELNDGLGQPERPI